MINKIKLMLMKLRGGFMFKITGKINGEIESITYNWKNGRGSIEGDTMVMFMMKGEMELNTPVGPVGQYMERDINDPLSALFMIRECFDEIISSEGSIPEAEHIPPGAIG